MDTSRLHRGRRGATYIGLARSQDRHKQNPVPCEPRGSPLVFNQQVTALQRSLELFLIPHGKTMSRLCPAKSVPDDQQPRTL